MLNRQIPFNPFEILLSIGKIQDSAFEYKDAILELKEDLWHPPKDPSVITEKYWNSLTEKQQKELHYYRNNYQKNIPKTKKEALESDGWVPDWLCGVPSGTHHFNGGEGNKDCRGIFKNSHIQVIYDEEGNLVTTPENLGTYDFAHPIFHPVKHRIMDIEPWLKWGNSPDDPTTREEREAAYVF